MIELEKLLRQAIAHIIPNNSPYKNIWFTIPMNEYLGLGVSLSMLNKTALCVCEDTNSNIELRLTDDGTILKDVWILLKSN